MNKTAKGLQRSSTPEQSLRSFLRTAAQKRHTLVSLISLAVFAVSGCLGLIPTLSLTQCTGTLSRIARSGLAAKDA